MSQQKTWYSDESLYWQAQRIWPADGSPLAQPLETWCPRQAEWQCSSWSAAAPALQGDQGPPSGKSGAEFGIHSGHTRWLEAGCLVEKGQPEGLVLLQSPDNQAWRRHVQSHQMLWLLRSQQLLDLTLCTAIIQVLSASSWTPMTLPPSNLPKHITKCFFLNKNFLKKRYDYDQHNVWTLWKIKDIKDQNKNHP